MDSVAPRPPPSEQRLRGRLRVYGWRYSDQDPPVQMLRTTDLDRLVTASATEELATHYGCHATHASMRFADKPAPFREAFSPVVRARRLHEPGAVRLAWNRLRDVENRVCRRCHCGESVHVDHRKGERRARPAPFRRRDSASVRELQNR